MIWVIGGTKEAAMLSKAYPLHRQILYTVATEESKEFLSTKQIRVGRINRQEMIDFVSKNKIQAIFDLSHPFADIVTNNAREMAQEFNLPYYRYIREKNIRSNRAIYANSYEEACGKIAQLTGTFFFTTGSKRVEEFQRVRGANRFIFRVLPSAKSLEELKNAGVEMKDSIAMLGPFSIEMNRLLLSEYQVDYLVTKDSGKTGGVNEKLIACQEENVTPIIIARTYEEGIESFEDLLGKVRSYIQ